MPDKHPAETKSTLNPDGSGSGTLDGYDRKNLELGEAMEHEHGQDREQTEQDVEANEAGKRKKSR